MGPNDSGLDKGFRATTAIPQFRVVHLTDVEDMALADGTETPLGVCQEEVSADDATLGRVAGVRMEGISRAVANAAVGLMDPVVAGADGRVGPLAAATADQAVVGFVMTPATAADRHIDLWLTPGLLRTTS